MLHCKLEIRILKQHETLDSGHTTDYTNYILFLKKKITIRNKMSSERPGPAVQIQFDHLESELIFQPTDGETKGVPCC